VIWRELVTAQRDQLTQLRAGGYGPRLWREVAPFHDRAERMLGVVEPPIATR